MTYQPSLRDRPDALLVTEEEELVSFSRARRKEKGKAARRGRTNFVEHDRGLS